MEWSKWAKEREKHLHFANKLSEMSEAEDLLKCAFGVRNLIFRSCDKSVAAHLGEDYKPIKLEYLFKRLFMEITSFNIDNVLDDNIVDCDSDLMGHSILDKKEYISDRSEEVNNKEHKPKDGKHSNEFQNKMSPDFMRCIYEVCAFTSIIMYLHITDRIPAKTEKDFIRHNSPLIKGMPSEQRENQIDHDAITFRAHKNRELSRKQVYPKNNEWRSIPADIEHEWKSYFPIIQSGIDETISETFKRLRLLTKDMDDIWKYQDPKVRSGVSISRIQKDIDKALSKFRSKLKKLKFENYADCIKFILEHLEEDKEYYASNIYRLERELSPYIISSEVQHLVEFPDDDLFRDKIIALSSVRYPKLYDCLVRNSDIKLIAACVYRFHITLEQFTPMACYLLDEQVEYNEDSWISFLKNYVGERASELFYSPDEINWCFEKGSQEAFEEVLALPCQVELNYLIAKAQCERFCLFPMQYSQQEQI